MKIIHTKVFCCCRVANKIKVFTTRAGWARERGEERVDVEAQLELPAGSVATAKGRRNGKRGKRATSQGSKLFTSVLVLLCVCIGVCV